MVLKTVNIWIVGFCSLFMISCENTQFEVSNDASVFVSEHSIEFPPTLVGSTEERTINLFSTSPYEINLIGINSVADLDSFSGPAGVHFQGQLEGCGNSTLQGSCDIRISFSPASAGVFEEGIQVRFIDLNGVEKFLLIRVRGEGLTVVPPVVAFNGTSPTYVNLSNVSAYPVSGTCNGADGTTISFNFGSPTVCSGGAFSANLDMTTAPDGFLFNGISATMSTATASMHARKDTIPLTPVINLDPFAPNPDTDGFVRIFVAGGGGPSGDAAVGLTASDFLVVNGTSAGLFGGAFDFQFHVNATAPGPFSVTLPAGVATDTAGNPNVATAVLNYNYVLDSIVFTSPSPGSFVNLANVGSFPVAGNCSGADGTPVSFNFGASTTCTGGVFSTSLDTSAAPQGSITLTATMLTASNNLSLNKDTLAPSVVLSTADNTAPVPDSDGVVGVTSTFSEAISGLAVGQYTYSNSSASSGVSGGPAVYSFNVTAGSQGSFSVTYPAGSVADAAGNTNTLSNTLSFVFTNPSLAFTSPVAGSFVNSINQGSFAVAGTCNYPDGTPISFNHSAGGLNCSSGTFSGNIDLTSAPEGPITLTATMVGANANLSLNKDSVRPSVVLSSPDPLSPTIDPDGSSGIVVTFSEPVTGLNVGLFTYTNASGSGFLGSGVNYSLNLDSGVDGLYSIQLNAALVSDAAGNLNTVSNLLGFNHVTPSIAFTSPAAGTYVNIANNGSFAVAGACNQADGTTISFNFGVNTSCSSGAFSTSLDMSAAPEGPITLTATMLTVTDSLSLNKDTISPGVTLGLSIPSITNTSTPVNVPVTVTGGATSVNLTNSDIALSGDSTGCSASVSNGTTLNPTITISGCSTAPTGTVNIQVVAGIASDVAGNPSTVSNSQSVIVASGTPFVSTWQTSSAGETLSLPLRNGFNYNFIVDWGDGSGPGTVTSFSDPDREHVFALAGNYTLTIYGTLEAFGSSLIISPYKDQIRTVVDLGDVNWVSLNHAFSFADSLTTVSGGDTSSVTDMSFMFNNSDNVVPDTSGWDTSNVLSMERMFAGADAAAPNTSGWVTSSVTNMAGMFFDNGSNPDTSGWDTSNVQNMNSMFESAVFANPDTSGWNTASVTDMGHMFREADSAAPSTSGWDTSLVTDMSYMFFRTDFANPDTSGWNTSSVLNMAYMFAHADTANPNTSGWDTSRVTDMSALFFDADVATPDTSSWITNDVTTMASMFQSAPLANPDTSSWNTGNVMNMAAMFYDADSANPDTSGWDTSKVTSMFRMFQDTALASPDTSGWNTASVTDMSSMFEDASQANPDTSGWDVSSVRSMSYMFESAPLANPDTSGWNTSSLEDMSFMFSSAISANPDVSGWNTSSVTTMERVFNNASIVTPNTSGWNTANVTDMGYSFANAVLANPDTSGWNTSNTIQMGGMFSGAVSAIPDTSGWNTSNVISMTGMFQGAVLANPDTSGWNTANVTDMALMFSGASAANPNTSGWDTSNVTRFWATFQSTSANPDTSGWNTSSVTSFMQMFHDNPAATPDTSGWNTSNATSMQEMFFLATAANPDTSGWDTSGVIDMEEMFRGASNAAPDTSGWDTSNVTTMLFMFFEATSANPDVSGWNTSSVTNMDFLFNRATLANPNLSSWDFSSVTRMQALITDTAISNLNYSNFLINLNSQGLTPIDPIGTTAEFQPAAAAARTSLLGAGWSISDGGPE